MALTAQQQAVLARPTWQADEEAPICNRCEAIFGFFLRKHHCRNCGLVFCYDCTPNTFDLPPEWGYEGPQRVCNDCFYKLVKEQEFKTSAKDEMLALTFYLRDAEVYRLRSRDIYDFGTRRAPEKTPANAEFKDKNDAKQDHIVTLLSTEKAPVSLAHAATKTKWEKVLYGLEHPFILPVLEADIIPDRNRAVVFRPFCSQGSLRDLIYQVGDPRLASHKKYPPRVPFDEYDQLLGMPESIIEEKCHSALKLSFIQTSGRQILEGLLYLQRSRVPYPHLHTGNVMVQKKRCCLSDFENVTCGLKPLYTLTLLNTAPEVECFGNVLYEMAMGFPRCPNILDPTQNIIIPKKCPPEVSEVLLAIFAGEAPMTIEKLLEMPFFARVQLKNQEAIPTKMKGMTKGMASYLQEIKEANEKFLREIYDRETERAKELFAEREKKEEERKIRRQENAARAELAAQGTLGEERVRASSRRPGEQASRALSPTAGLDRRGSEAALNDESRRNAARRRASKRPSVTATTASPSPVSSPPPSSSASFSVSPSRGAPAAPSSAPAPPPPPPAAPAPPPPPPSGPPAPPKGGPPAGAPPPSSGRNALLDSIRNPNVKLKKTKTVDKSVPKQLR